MEIRLKSCSAASRLLHSTSGASFSTKAIYVPKTMWRELKFENTKSSCYWRWADSAIRSVRWCTSVACRSSVTFHKTTPSQQQTSHVPSKLWLRALEWATSNRYEILMTTTTSLCVSPFKGSNKRVVTGTDRGQGIVLSRCSSIYRNSSLWKWVYSRTL